MLRSIAIGLITVAVFLCLPHVAMAQTCVAGEIPNFLIDHAASTATGVTFTWDPPPGVSSPVYEVVRDEATTWCDIDIFNPQSPVEARLTGTRHFVVFPQDRALCYRVRLEGCELFDTEYCWAFPNFSSPPLAPNLISAAATGSAQVTITFSHPDPRTFLALERAGSDGVFKFAAGLEGCPVNTVMSHVDTGQFMPGGVLAPGTYQYRLVAYTWTAETTSNVITVVVGGGAPCVPPQVAPQVSSPNTNVQAGDPATVNWTTSETVDRFVIEVSAAGATRSFTVRGSQRSATFSFPQAGTFAVKVIAENACGRKEGVPVLTFNVAPAPAELVRATPAPSMLGIPGAPAATDSFTLANLGGTATAVQLERVGEAFFVHSPAQFTLAPEGRQIVTVSATTQQVGQHLGELVATGTGGASELRIPVALLVETRPSGNPDPQPDANRVDVAAPAGQSPTGTVRFDNRGNGTVKGILLADPWIILQEKFLIIPAGGSATVSFRIERSLRSSDQGSEVGTIILVYLEGPPAKTAALRFILGADPPPGSKSTLVPVTDTVKPNVTTGTIPAIAAGEVAYFVSGIGHTVAPNGAVTKSDVALLNTSLADTPDLRVFFAAAGGAASAQGASFSALSADQTLKMSDVTKSLFSAEVPTGTLQIRASALSALTVDARTFLEIPTGTVGALIPIFRSDRAAATQEKLYLTGLKKEGTNYRTDLYLQETSGQSGAAEIQFLSASGSTVGANRTVTLEPFGLVKLDDAVPSGAVAAVVTNTSTAGRVQAYGSVIDLRTNDNWTVADWSRVHGYTRNEPVVVPVAGKVRGRNNTDFRSDLALINTGTTSASGTLSYQPDVGPSRSQVLTLGAGESRILTDVLAAQFNLTAQGVGYLVFTPTNGTFVVSSRTYTQSSAGPTLSTGVPALALAGALKPGQVRKISNLEDATFVTVSGAKPGTFRTNFGLLETKGQAAKVRVTLRYTAVQGAASAAGVASQEFSLAPGQFMMWSGITTTILQGRRGEFGDLRDLQADFELIEGPGEVMVFTTSTDNGTNDTSLRVE
jgi:hypothetical protein